MPNNTDSIGKISQAIGDKFEIIDLIDKGGMGEIYLGIHKALGKKVAIKIIHQNLSGNDDVRERFFREAKLAANLDHHGIIDIYDFGNRGDFDYLIMPFITGETLQKKLKAKGRLDLGKSLKYMISLTDALAYAHSKNVIHRDIKPANFIIDDLDNIILTDFGISKNLEDPNLTSTNMVLGSPRYMSPEQMQGKQVDDKADLYALGLIFCEMVTGHYPFKGKTVAEICVSHQTQFPNIQPIKQISGMIQIESVILKLLEKAPEDRYQSAYDLLNDLKTIKKNLDVPFNDAADDPDATQLAYDSAEEDLPTVSNALPGQPDDKTQIAPGDEPIPIETASAPIETTTDPTMEMKNINKKFKYLTIGVAVCFLILVAVMIYYRLSIRESSKSMTKLPQESESVEDVHLKPTATKADSIASIKNNIEHNLDGLFVRPVEEKNKIFTHLLKSKTGPIATDEIEHSLTLNVGFKSHVASKHDIEASVLSIIDQIDGFQSVTRGPCDILITLNTLFDETKLTIETNIGLSDNKTNNKEKLQTEPMDNFIDRFKKIMIRNYCFNAFSYLSLIAPMDRRKDIKIQIHAKKDAQKNRETFRKKFQIGEIIDICMTPSQNLYGMLFDVNLDGIYLLFPWLNKQNNFLPKNKKYCSGSIEVFPPPGIELVAALVSNNDKIISLSGIEFTKSQPYYNWAHTNTQNNSISFCIQLLTTLMNQSEGTWSCDQKFIQTFF